MAELSQLPAPGWDAYDLVEWFVREHPEISSIRFTRYCPSPSVVNRNNQAGHAFKLMSLSSLDQELWFPNHEGTLIESVETGVLTDEMLANAVWHDDGLVESAPLTPRDLSRAVLQAMISPATTAIAISSKITLQSGERHIPMMDFQCPATVVYLKAIARMMKAIGQTRGAILNSGKSFHYFGFELLSSEEWQRFLGKSLLVTPLTDTRYIGHRCISGECTLRLFSDRSVPHVVELL